MSTVSTQVIGPTFEEAEERSFIIPKGNYDAKITNGMVVQSKFPASSEYEPVLVARHGEGYFPYQLELELTIISGEDGDQNGKTAKAWFPLEGKQSYKLRHIAYQVGIQDIQACFDTSDGDYVGDDARPKLPADPELAWRDVGNFYLTGVLVDAEDKAFRSAGGEGIIGGVINIRIGAPKKPKEGSDGDGWTGNITPTKPRSEALWKH